MITEITIRHFDYVSDRPFEEVVAAFENSTATSAMGPSHWS
jgi:hypothetical protein